MLKAQLSISQKEFEFLLSGMGIEKEFSGLINVDTLRKKIQDYAKKYDIRVENRFDEFVAKKESQQRQRADVDDLSDLIVRI